MATAGIQFKVMPKNLEIDLKKLKKQIKSKIESFESGVFNEAKEEPIAFGLNALIITIALSEDEEHPDADLPVWMDQLPDAGSGTAAACQILASSC